ncbi:IS3 family transposase [Streptosporangium sp. NPDC000509]|uniref:IS3 family transposase n=1 Tax=Streptosporangium sp. NPDC000509 TaxID=3366186 RepID=UPI0036AEF0BB
MGLVGSSLDDDAAESLFSSLEFELFRILGPFATREQARRAVAVWVDDFDTMRLHSANGMCCPVEYEHQRAATRSKRGRAATIFQRVPHLAGGAPRSVRGRLLRSQGSPVRSLRDGLRPPSPLETSSHGRPLKTAGNTTQQNHGVLLSWRGHRKCLTRPAQGVWSDQEGFLPVRR